MSSTFEKAFCSECKYKSKKFLRGGAGKRPEFYSPVACITTKEIVSIDIASKNEVFRNQKFDCPEEKRIYYSDKKNQSPKTGKFICPNCSKYGLSFRVIERVFLD